MTDTFVLIEKFKEAARSVFPIASIVAAVCFFLIPVTTDLMLAFLIATALLILGMGLFTYGAERSMTMIGTYVGARMTRSRKLWLILCLSFLLGFSITISEPDLQVLASYVPHIHSGVLLVAVGIGVGLFLMLCLLRIFLGIPLRWLLLFFYTLVFLLASLSDRDFLSVAFDSGGVTTGPMTVPFIMAMGVGVSAIRSDKNAEADSFGLVALCSIGPVLAVLVLGFFYNDNSASAYAAGEIARYLDTVELTEGFLHTLPEYLKEMAMALTPIVIFFLCFQWFSLKLQKIPFLRILIGLCYTYVGLVLFLTGVNVGFSPLGTVLGRELVSGEWKGLLIPLSVLMGWFIIRAEPAIHTLNKQVEEVSAGAVSERAMGLSLSIAIAAANGLAMVRVITGWNILYFLVPGYLLALALSRFVPPIFTSIAFDSGGVASGPMTATFMLPFAMGACQALGGNVLTDAFGLVALVAMMPLITVQIMGVVSLLRKKNLQSLPADPFFGEDEIIELWEVA
ncbi:MAG: DUF1538 domain-containing protein [Oscillospiraceae bacterium]|nr:DUF1538 domain-containing protein [Oscillospiraceae bacterium]